MFLRPLVLPPGSWRAAARPVGHQCQEEQNNEHEEQDLSDSGGRCSDPAKPENGGDKRNDQKDCGPVQQRSLLPFTWSRTAAPWIWFMPVQKFFVERSVVNRHHQEESRQADRLD
jgi:hypothetical protein